MSNENVIPVVGLIAEYFDDTVQVVAVDARTHTFDLNYTNPCHGTGPAGFQNRPWSELRDIGDGRIIWNHE